MKTPYFASRSQAASDPAPEIVCELARTAAAQVTKNRMPHGNRSSPIHPCPRAPIPTFPLDALALRAEGAASMTTIDRRDFLKTAATAAGLTIVPASAVRGTQANSKLEIGIIGSGGRGKFIAQLFEKNTPTKVVALHDYFADRVAELGDALSVAPDARFTGLDGYHQLIAKNVDAVAVESPPYFHPEQAIAALEAGKHVYLAK